MGKWFGNIVTTLVIVALTSLVGTVLKGPIDNLASGDRLNAQVQLSPWIPRPDASDRPDTKQNKKEDALKDRIDKIVSEAGNRLSISSGDTFQLARVIITNDSSRPISDASMRIESPYTPKIVVIVDETGKSTVLRDVERIRLPTMRPGDKIGVFMWSDYFTSNHIEDNFKTYSSSGKFRLSFDWPSSQSSVYDSAIGQFLDEWTPLALGCSIVLICLVLGIGLTVQSTYIKGLLNNEKFYYAEQKRYEDDPQKFTASFTEGEKAAKSKTR